MTTTKDYAQRRLGGGKLYINEFDDTGALTTEEWFGITEELVQTVEQEFITIENTEGTSKFDDTKVLSKTTITLAWKTKNVSPVNIKRAFLGDKTENVIASGTDAQVTGAVVLDTAIPLNYKFASNIVVKDATDSTTYVLDTDYTVDTTVEPYTVTPLSTGSISASDVLHIGYDYAGYTEGLIKAFVLAKIEAQLRFKMANSLGSDYDITYPKCTVSSDGDFDLKAVEDAGYLSFKATVVKYGTEPLFKVEYAELT